MYNTNSGRETEQRRAGILEIDFVHLAFVCVYCRMNEERQQKRKHFRFTGSSTTNDAEKISGGPFLLFILQLTKKGAEAVLELAIIASEALFF